MRLWYKRKKNLKYKIKNQNIKYRGYKIMEPQQGLKNEDILLIYPQIFCYVDPNNCPMVPTWVFQVQNQPLHHWANMSLLNK